MAQAVDPPGSDDPRVAQQAPDHDSGLYDQHTPDSTPDVADEATSRRRSVRRLSLALQSSSTESDTESKFPELGLSGNVISVNFCVPYRVAQSANGEWELSPRMGTSALFDSFTHLSSGDSSWTHTLIGWTGEIARTEVTENGCSAPALPINKLAEPIPVDWKARAKTCPHPTEVSVSPRDRRNLRRMLTLEHGGRIHPVWLPDEIGSEDSFVFRDQEKWRRYGENELFNLFHYKQNEPSDGRASKAAWKDYEQLNYAFAAAVMDVYRPGDLVIVHDYHLLLLPRLLRQYLPNIFLELFLHIPFPSSEYFRALPKREHLLHSMLGADMIGFQTDSYATHFKFCCERILHLEASDEGVDYLDLHTTFEAFPIGINAITTLRSAFEPTVDDKIDRLFDEKVYDGKKVIVGRDRLDSARGVAQKLQAFEMFLERHPEWIEKVVLVQVTSPTSVDQQQGKRDKIENIVARINGNLGHLGYTPVQYYPQYLSKEEYFALLRIADLGLITSVRDGMNTTALEYVICQRDKRSPLMISEFSGTVSILQDAININPWDLGGVANKIHEALSLSEPNKTALHHDLYTSVMENDVQRWTTRCINRLVANLIANGRYQLTPALDRPAMQAQYTISKRRLFMFDYDGTLTPIVTSPAAAIPTARVLHTLESLASDPRNAVWIISGRDQNFLETHMGHIHALGLSAEHGCFMRMPGSTTWTNLISTLDMSWQVEARSIMDRYTALVQGSHTEQKKIAMTWHYRQAEDADLARQLAPQCQADLNGTVAKEYDVDIMAGKANVEVRPHFVNKGEIVKRLVEAYGKGEDQAPDFVLCLGDDSTDEDMFQKLRCSSLPLQHVFAVTVGAKSKPTLASWYVPEPEDVVAALGLLTSLASSEGQTE